MSLTHRLEGASVIRLQPREDRLLTAVRGRLWVNVPGGTSESRRAGTDHMLVPGDRMLLRAGETAVVSSGPRGFDSVFSLEAYEPGSRRAPRAPRPTALQSFMAGVLGWRFARQGHCTIGGCSSS